MNTNSKIYQLKQIVKDIAVLQKTIKNHRKTVNFKGERQTIELITYDHVMDQNRNWSYVPRKSKVYLTPSNTENLISARWGWRPQDDKSDHVSFAKFNIIDLGDDLTFSTTSYMARIFNEAYALLRYERKTKKNEQLEEMKKNLEERNWWHDQAIKKIMNYFRDEESEQKAQ